MSYFDGEGSGGSRWSRGYGYARDMATESPTLFTAVLTIIACITSVWSGMEDIGSVAGPCITAILFIVHNIHVRKSHGRVEDALNEVKAARTEILYTRTDLSDNTQHSASAAQSSMEAAEAAKSAADSAKRIEKLIAEQKQLLEKMNKK